jgi:hypothetical protein
MRIKKGGFQPKSLKKRSPGKSGSRSSKKNMKKKQVVKPYTNSPSM